MYECAVILFFFLDKKIKYYRFYGADCLMCKVKDRLAEKMLILWLLRS